MASDHNKPTDLNNKRLKTLYVDVTTAGSISNVKIARTKKFNV